jgi:adenylyl-sulfate kinase
MNVQERPVTVWLTGLSGAGKSTIGRQVVDALRVRGHPAVLLDGDEVRAHLTREVCAHLVPVEQVARVGWLCELLNRHGVTAVAALVSPYRAARDAVRSRVDRFIEVHVEAPVAVLEERDPKGLYRRVREGSLTGLTGVDDPYEPPERPELRCSTDRPDANETCVQQILAVLDLP